MIEVHHLTKTFGEKVAVNDLSLRVAEGEIYGLVGPDGAGKTTTMRLLCGALRPDAGEVRIAGHDVARQVNHARAQIGYLSQRFSLYEELTVLENIRFFAEVRGLSRQAWYPRSMEILAFVGLEDFVNRRAGHLSGGMKQKLGLATALVHRPRVLLLDEPTGGVDPVTRQDFWQLIIRLVREEGVTVLVSTPYMDEAVRCTRVGFMQEGRLLVEDTPDALRARLEGRVLELRGEPLRRWRHLLADDPDVEAVQAFGDRLHLRLRRPNARAVIRRLKRQARSTDLRLERLAVIPPGLEDVFIALLETSLPP